MAVVEGGTSPATVSASALASTKAARDGISIPRLIKRNTLLLAITQALVGVGTQMTPTLGPVMAIELTGMVALAGLSTALSNGSKLLIAYPIGYVTDIYGRKVGVLIGMTLALVGTIILGFSMAWHAFPLFVPGLIVFGLGVGAIHQLRLAAADMYPPTRRAEGLGYVLTGSLIGALGGPVLISVATAIAPGLQVDPTAMAWWLVPIVILPSMGLVLLVRPDPKEIAANLARYYPGYIPPPPRPPTAAAPATGFRAFVAHYPKRVAFVSSFAVHGNMTMMMAMTAVALHFHGHELPAISLAVALHVMGMFGLSIPLGLLADRVGRRALLLAGMGVQFIGSLLVVLTGDYWTVTAGTVLVGVGWSCVNVASSVLIADTTAPQERGRAIGTNEAFSNGASMIMPLAAGPIVAVAGLPILGLVSLVLLAVPAYFQFRLVETSPGKYRDTPG